jgi:molecular chaperone DnaK (HSP70)
MSYVLGIDIGGSAVKVAVRRYTADGWSAVRRLPDPRPYPYDLIRRVGDEVGILAGRAPEPAHSLLARLVGSIVDTAWRHESGPAERVVLTHPTGWGAYRRDLLAGALRDAELPGVLLLPAALAVAATHEATGWLPAGGLVAVHRVGGRGVESSVLDLAGPGDVRLLGAAELDGAGGAELDDAVRARIMAMAGPDAEAPTARDCTAAREKLSAAAEVVVDVPAPRAPLRGIRVGLTRADLRRAARPVLGAGVDLLLQVVHAVGAHPSDLGAVLLAGGVAGTPALAELIGEVVPVPVRREEDPQLTVAAGAVMLALASARGAGAPDGRPAGDHSARSPRSLDSGPPAAGGAPAGLVLAGHTGGWGRP